MSNQQRGIQTVESAGQILQLICSSPKSLSLSEIAEIMQLAPGSAYKYLVSLLRTGLLKRNENTLEYEAGPLCLRMGLSKIHHDTLLEQVRRSLTVLADKYQLNVFASMWSKYNGPTVVFYKQTGGFFHIGFRLGIQLSLQQTASGRIFATYLDSSEIESYYAIVDKEGNNGFNTCDFEKVLEQIKNQGYSQLVGSPTPGISSIAVPVFNSSDEFIMTITAFQNSEMLTSDVENTLIAELKNIALELKERQHG